MNCSAARAENAFLIRPCNMVLAKLPDFVEIFGNDVIHALDRKEIPAYGDHSDIYVYNPLSGDIARPYARMMAGLKIYSSSEGRATILENRDVIIEQSDTGRLMRLSDGALGVIPRIVGSTPVGISLSHFCKKRAKFA